MRRMRRRVRERVIILVGVKVDMVVVVTCPFTWIKRLDH